MDDKINILKVKDLSFQYNDKDILHQLNFKVSSNEVIGIFGDSGSGKSTFCKILSGFLKNYMGSVTINDKKIEKGFNPIQLIYQHPEKVMNPNWKMGKVIKESWNPPNCLLDDFGIRKEWFERYPSELSGGELQRFSIIRALNPKTKFIVADEITTMLDARTQSQIWHKLLSRAKSFNIGIIAISHEINLLNRISDKVVYFEDINKN